MLFIANWLVFFVFWFFVVKLGRKDGLRFPAAMALLWLFGYFSFPLVGIEGGLFFITYAAILGLILIYVDMTREHMGLRKQKPDPASIEPGIEQENST